MTTVPQDANSRDNSQSPQQVSTVTQQGIPPLKPAAVTGTGGSSISIPTPGKPGK